MQSYSLSSGVCVLTGPPAHKSWFCNAVSFVWTEVLWNNAHTVTTVWEGWVVLGVFNLLHMVVSVSGYREQTAFSQHTNIYNGITDLTLVGSPRV